jgi:hypothetical protein
MIQEMQNRLMQAQEELAAAEVEGTAGGGMVTARVNGAKQVIAIKIAPEAVDPDDIELLEDMILAALNDAMNNAEELAAEKLGGITGGIKIPGLM